MEAVVLIIGGIVAIVGGLWVLIFGQDTVLEKTKSAREWLRRLDRSPDSPPVSEYLECLTRELATVDYRGFGSAYRGKLHVKLANVFVPLTSSTATGRRLTPSPYTGLYMRRDDSRTPLTKLIVESERSIVLGRAGAGKTTLMHYIALSLAEAHLSGKRASAAAELDVDENRLPIPIYMPLRDFALEVSQLIEGERKPVNVPGLGVALENYLSALVPGAKGEEMLERLLKGSNPCLLLLDGLDEAGAPEVRTLVRELIERWITDHPNHWYIITARPESYVGPASLAGDFETWEIADFSYEDIVAYVHAWYRDVFTDHELEVEEVTHEADDLMQAINRMEDVRALAPNPLLLTAILLIHLTRGVLPDRRCDLFESCTRALLGEWDMSKEGTGSKTDLLFRTEADQSATSRRTHLEYVAYHLVETDREIVAGEDLAEVLVAQAPHFRQQPGHTVQSQKERALEFLAALAARGGVIEEVREGQYSFAHPSFRSYLAARRLARHDDFLKVVREKAADSKWHDVIRLACGHISQRHPERATEMVDLLTDLGPDHGLTSLEALTLAAGCLLDADRPSLSIGIMDRVVSQALTAMTNPDNDPKARAHLGSTVGWLGDSRDLTEVVDVPAGGFTMGSHQRPQEHPPHEALTEGFSIGAYPVTNAEYDQFIRDHGYKDPGWWTEAGWVWRKAGNVEHPFHWKDPVYRVPNHPVVGVSWFEAMAFAEWAGGRLPTEREWERAARSTDARNWPWGNTFEHSCCNTSELSIGGPTPVGMFADHRSPYKAHDMAGNIWEWMGNLYGPYPYDGDDGREDPDANGSRVLRGGSWYGTSADARCTSRRWLHPSTRHFNFGFRVVTNCARKDSESA